MKRKRLTDGRGQMLYMGKRAVVKIMSILMCSVLLGGCWDYKGMDELTIVAGIAIDLDQEDPEMYVVTFEIVDMATSSEKTDIKSKLLETRGKTITEAMFNANRKLQTNMYFGNAELLVLSRQLVEEKGLDPVLDPFFRDNGIRDNMYIMVSGNKTAKEILAPTEKIISFYIQKTLSEVNFAATSTRPCELYQVYNMIEENTTDLALPVVFISGKEAKDIGLEGLALFSGSKKIGDLNNRDTSYYLLTASGLNGGSFELSTQAKDGGDKKYIAFVDRQSIPSHDFTFDGDRFTLTVKIEMIVSIVEFFGDWGEMDKALIGQLEKNIAEMLSQETRRVIQSIQSEYGIDIVGFACKIHNKNPTLWKEVQDNWREYLKNAEVQVDCSVLIDDAGLIKKY